MRHWTAGAAFAIAMGAFAAAAAPPPFTDRAGGFSLAIPDGWRSMLADRDGARSLELTSADGRLALSVTSVPAAGPDEVAALRHRIEQRLLMKATLFDEAPGRLGDVPATIARYRWDAPGGTVIFRIAYAEAAGRGFAAWTVIPEREAAVLDPQADALLATFRALSAGAVPAPRPGPVASTPEPPAAEPGMAAGSAAAPPTVAAPVTRCIAQSPAAAGGHLYNAMIPAGGMLRVRWPADWSATPAKAGAVLRPPESDAALTLTTFADDPAIPTLEDATNRITTGIGIEPGAEDLTVEPVQACTEPGIRLDDAAAAGARFAARYRVGETWHRFEAIILARPGRPVFHAITISGAEAAVQAARPEMIRVVRAIEWEP